ncbi:hypothetical protein [Flavobacterium sp.]|uniref:hypothetical protein n=1 Tax=Flavobacterium sp. TaxID=239 RepID=UPI00374DBC37
METITTTKADEILKTLKKIDQKTDQLEANSIENLSKLIDDKFQKNFLKVGSVETQKLSKELDLQIKHFQLQNEIASLADRKKEIEKLHLDKNRDKLSIVDQEILSKLLEMSSDGGILDKFLKAISNDDDFSYFNLLSISFLRSSIFDLERKLSNLVIQPEPVIP